MNKATATSPGDVSHARWRVVVRRLLRWTEHGLAAFGTVTLFYLLFLDVSVVVSPSMQPTLQGTRMTNGDRVLTERVTKWFRSPRRGEVVTFVSDDGAHVMKRVVGLPGEQVQLSEQGRLLIDGQPVELPAALDQRFLRYGNLAAGKPPVSCGQGYYLLGDDSRDSDDSRFNGPVPLERIIGRAWVIVWPWSRIGWINP